MRIRNTRDDFGVVSKTLHWLIAVIMMTAIPIGWFVSTLSDETVLFWRMLDIHVTLGLSVFALFVVKAVWLVVSPAPPPLPSVAYWERRAARFVHGILIAAMIFIPVTGFIYLATNGEPFDLYGLVEIPDLGRLAKGTRTLIFDLHAYAAYTVAALIVVHIAAALKHHLIDRDATLRRIGF